MNTTANKKDFFYIIVFILTLIIVIVGATFALYSFVKSVDNTTAVYTGNLKIEYDDGPIIKCDSYDKLLTPRLEVNLNDEKNVYKNNFRVTNNGTLKSFLSINLEINVNEFPEDTLMYSLFDGDKPDKPLVENFLLPGVEEVELFDNIELDKEITKDFILFIWIKENGTEQEEAMKKSLIGQIRVDATQNKK